MNLLVQLQEDLGLGYLFIAHDLGLTRRIAHRTAVTYLGRIVETGPTHDVHTAPSHPYTRSLLAAGSAAGADQGLLATFRTAGRNLGSDDRAKRPRRLPCVTGFSRYVRRCP